MRIWLGGCLGVFAGLALAARHTTDSHHAWVNVNAQLAQWGDGAQSDELQRLRFRLLADNAALDHIARQADAAAPDGIALLHRARNRAALHRFREALIDLDGAEQAGVGGLELSNARIAIRIAVGNASETVPLIRQLRRSAPSAGTWTLQAQACATLGQFERADWWYRRALAALPGVSPFPEAELAFARGVLWSELAGQRARGRRYYLQALTHVPEFVAARVHLAELEAQAKRPLSALALLAPIVRADGEPEALALSGRLRVQSGDANGYTELRQARSRFEILLAHQPLAFADHAARFFLEPEAGADMHQAWLWAQVNLHNRPSPAAYTLLNEAAKATGRSALLAPPRITVRCD